MHNYLDLVNLTFNKVTMKVMVCGKMMCGVGFKHVTMPLKETAEFMRMGIQSLTTLLPFVRKVEWLEGPIEFGHDFNQHHTYDVYHCDNKGVGFDICVGARGDRGERGVKDDKEEDEDDREMISENEREISSKGDQVVEMTLLLMEDEQEEADEDDSRMDGTLLTTLLIPNTIPRWSLLIQLTLKEGDSIGNNNAGCSSIPQVPIFLKSLNEGCKTRIQPLLGVQLSSPLSPLPHHYFGVVYNYLGRTPEHPYVLVFESEYWSNNYVRGHDLAVSFTKH
ncbi:uncharacterized protein LOC114720871 [Neltuma alba]|uniref:uncharacterized protein LOC114720871 n=1 Tax=Neltuma alba TaxID=207710 RepID=UPI0010A4E772|nr:uncharacterized protein LOC114720871 [Prosopis alba]